MSLIAIFVALVFLHSLVSARLERTIVLGLVFLEQELHGRGENVIRLAVMTTVLSSIFAHGPSAMPGMELYARRIARLPPDAPELEEAKL